MDEFYTVAVSEVEQGDLIQFAYEIEEDGEVFQVSELMSADSVIDSGDSIYISGESEYSGDKTRYEFSNDPSEFEDGFIRLPLDIDINIVGGTNVY